MPEQFGEKKYDATPYRRQKAREEGRVPRSQDLSSASVLVGALGVLLLIGESTSGELVEFMRYQLGSEAWLRADADFAFNQWMRIVYLLVQTVLPVISLTLLFALVANLGQTGLLFLPQKLSLDIKRVSPIAGIKRLFSLSNIVRLGFGLVKVAIVITVAVVSLVSDGEIFLVMNGMDAVELLSFVSKTTLWTSMKIGIALLILALFDYFFQRWKHEQDLRMTEQELRDEMKNTQGDPQVLQRRRMVQRQLAMNRVSEAVPKSDVITTNPTELAVAIRYDIDTMAAPIVVAKGAGVVAQQIRRLGLENGIPIVERKELTRMLYQEVEVGQEIPPDHYAAVAEILRYVYELQGKNLPTLEDADQAA